MRVYARQRLQLLSEESFRHVQEISIGSGRQRPETARRILDGWARDANGGQLPTRKATPGQLAAIGIKVVRHKRRNG